MGANIEADDGTQVHADLRACFCKSPASVAQAAEIESGFFEIPAGFDFVASSSGFPDLYSSSLSNDSLGL